MITTDVLLVLPLYLILFFIWYQFRHVIKAMTDVEHILNDEQFFGDVVDTPKEGIEQHKKRECLKSAISSSKAHLLGKKWTDERVHKASDETINKAYAEYKQRELNEKGEKAGKALGKHVISLYSTGISRVVKIRDIKKLQQDIETDPIIKDQMENLDCLLVCTFGNFLAPILVAAHTVNNSDLSDEQGLDRLTAQHEGYESDYNKKMALYCHRKINSITCVCGYVGTYHACDHVVNGTITICPCPDNCKFCQEEVDKREYYDRRWRKNEDGHTVCEMYMES